MAGVGVYDPEIVELMGLALERAWAQFAPHPKDKDLARLLMASAILEKVDAGVRAADLLTEAAILALQAALSSPLLQTALRREARVPWSAVAYADAKGPVLALTANRSFSVESAESRDKAEADRRRGGRSERRAVVLRGA